jgi:hypothetical protein
MTATKQHFEMIARVIERERSQVKNGYMPRAAQKHALLTLTHTAHHFADELAQTNPRFDRQRFLRACGVEADDNA